MRGLSVIATWMGFSLVDEPQKKYYVYTVRELTADGDCECEILEQVSSTKDIPASEYEVAVYARSPIFKYRHEAIDWGDNMMEKLG